MSISKELLRQKSKAMIIDLKEIQKMLKNYSYEEIATNEILHTLAERRLERTINRALDINFHLIRALNAPPPDDYTHSFFALSDLKVMPLTLAKAIAPSAAARNILIHGYDDLDSKKFYSSLKDAIKLFPRYIKMIEKFIEKR